MIAAAHEQPDEVIPGIEDGARGLRFDDQLHAAGQRERVPSAVCGASKRANQAGASRPAFQVGGGDR